MTDKASDKSSGSKVTVVTSPSKRIPQFGKDKKVLIALLILVLLISVGGYLVISRLLSPKLSVTKQKAVIAHTEVQINSGNYKAALDTSKKLLKDLPQDSPQRYLALTNLGTAYVTNHQIDLALQAYLQAEAIKKEQTSYSVFVTMAQIYTQKGDKAKAIEYYQKAIARTKATPEDADDLYVPNYQAQIKALQQ